MNITSKYPLSTASTARAIASLLKSADLDLDALAKASVEGVTLPELAQAVWAVGKDIRNSLVSADFSQHYSGEEAAVSLLRRNGSKVYVHDLDVGSQIFANLDTIGLLRAINSARVGTIIQAEVGDGWATDTTVLLKDYEDSLVVKSSFSSSRELECRGDMYGSISEVMGVDDSKAFRTMAWLMFNQLS